MSAICRDSEPVKIEMGMSGTKYRDILGKNPRKSVNHLNMQLISQHSNKPKHKAKAIMACLARNKADVLEVRSQSPDRILKGYTLNELKVSVHQRKPTNKSMCVKNKDSSAVPV